ncbi:uncharacterized protein LOC120084011 [Benincasa hispida]|uniref:uncharacterized protein LOC120084011 n=1 Tax=Benincasa hispida TaxID=102211 RepID=UPI0018FF84D3|nr:uncharacterized protein LOC120084011 [Benincasa hispida]
MLSDGVEPNKYTLTSVLSTCCIMLTLGLGAQIHSLSVEPSLKVFGRGGEEMNFLQQQGIKVKIVPGTPLQFVSWVRACVTSPKFFMMINGSLEGFFPGRKGLRFHDRCEHLGLTHLVFADDLMIFCAVERDSLEFVRQVLTEFAELSGLVANVGKSSMFVAGVESREAEELTVYMGVSLGRLRAMDCAPLIQRITACIRSWAGRSLSFAGRLQLVSYLWKGSVVSQSGARVAWDEVCVSLEEGGLGVKHVASWNQAAIMKLLWHLLMKSGSLWVAWVEANVLRGRSLWAVRSKSCFVWWDPWLPGGALLDSYGSTMIHDARSSLEARLSEFLNGEGGWRWPTVSWDLLEIWGFIQAVGPRMRGEDYWVWVPDASGRLSIASAWESIRPRRHRVSWVGILWAGSGIPLTPSVRG